MPAIKEPMAATGEIRYSASGEIFSRVAARGLGERVNKTGIRATEKTIETRPNNLNPAGSASGRINWLRPEAP